MNALLRQFSAALWWLYLRIATRKGLLRQRDELMATAKRCQRTGQKLGVYASLQMALVVTAALKRRWPKLHA